MSAESLELYERAKVRWPNQPLVVFECGGQLEILPIGARITSFTVTRICGIVNADGSMVAVPLDESGRPT